MAGISNNPNSPRQKMINLMYLVFIAMMAALLLWVEPALYRMLPE